MPWINYVLASVPLLFPAYLSISFAQIESNSNSSTSSASSNADITLPSVSSQLVAYLAMGIFGFILTDRLVPKIKVGYVFNRTILYRFVSHDGK